MPSAICYSTKNCPCIIYVYSIKRNVTFGAQIVVWCSILVRGVNVSVRYFKASRNNEEHNRDFAALFGRVRGEELKCGTVCGSCHFENTDCETLNCDFNKHKHIVGAHLRRDKNDVLSNGRGGGREEQARHLSIRCNMSRNVENCIF